MKEYRITEVDLLINMPLSKNEEDIITLIVCQSTFEQTYALICSVLSKLENIIERRVLIRRIQLIISTRIAGIVNYIDSSYELRQNTSKRKEFANLKNADIILEELYKVEAIGYIKSEYFRRGDINIEKQNMCINTTIEEFTNPLTLLRQEVEISEEDLKELSSGEFARMSIKKKGIALFFMQIVNHIEYQEMIKRNYSYKIDEDSNIAKFVSLISSKAWNKNTSSNSSYNKLYKVCVGDEDESTLNDMIYVRNLLEKYSFDISKVDEIIAEHKKSCTIKSKEKGT